MNITPWCEIPDKRKTIGDHYPDVPDEDKQLPPLAYFLKGVWDWHAAGARTFILSSNYKWMNGEWGIIADDVDPFMPDGSKLITGIRPLEAQLSSMWDKDGWGILGKWIELYDEIVLDLEVIFKAGRFPDGLDLNAWYEVLKALPAVTIINWNFPAIWQSDDDSPHRNSDTLLMCYFIRHVRPNDKIMSAGVAWHPQNEHEAVRHQLLIDACGEDRVLDRMLIAPADEAEGLRYYSPTEALSEIRTRGGRNQILWCDTVRWTWVAEAAANKWRSAVEV